MDPHPPELLRSRTLTNSAAEFVERRAGLDALSLISNVSDAPQEVGEGPEFIPEFDRFFPKGYVFDLKKVYDESSKTKQAFCASLQNLAFLLRERKVDQQLNITIKNPSEFSMEYILEVINKIEHGPDTEGRMKVCKTFVRRCHRKMEDNKAVVEGFLAMIPTDIYGSVLSGGITLILAAVEKHFQNREDIHSFLAEIPEKLEQIQRLSGLHYKSPKLHCCADAIMTAIFGTLESIVNQITNTWKVKMQKLPRKIRSAFDSHKDKRRDPKPANSVSEALAELQVKIDAFQKEVDICNQARLGRIEASQQDLQYGLSVFAKGNERYLKTLEQSIERVREQLGASALDNQFLLARFLDVFYQLLASSPNFNSKTGKVDYEQVKLITAAQEPIIQQSHQVTNTKLMNKWTKSIAGHGSDPVADVKDCLFHSEQLEPTEKDQSQWILQSDELATWIKEDETSIFDITLSRPPEALTNPLSFTSALLTKSMQATQQFPCLAYFCMHRNNESAQERVSGPAALVVSLIIQLIQFIAHHRPTIDLSALEDESGRSHNLSKAKGSVKHGLALLKRLLLLLPDNDVVFIILDGLSWLSGNFEGGEELAKKLTRIVNGLEHITVKVLVMDAMPGSQLAKAAHLHLSVPSMVPGSGVIDVHDNNWTIAERIYRMREERIDVAGLSEKGHVGEDSSDYESL